jgi:hypothetical protein
MLINVNHIDLSKPTTVLSKVGSSDSISNVQLTNTHSTLPATISLLLRSKNPYVDYYLMKRFEVMPSAILLLEDIEYDSKLYSLCVVSEVAPASYTLAAH